MRNIMDILCFPLMNAELRPCRRSLDANKYEREGMTENKSFAYSALYSLFSEYSIIFKQTLFIS